jgi:hypothetical protein
MGEEHGFGKEGEGGLSAPPNNIPAYGPAGTPTVSIEQGLHFC